MRFYPAREAVFGEVAGTLRDEAAIRADQHAVGEHAARVSEAQARVVAVFVREQDRVAHGAVLEEILHGLRVVDRDADDLEAARPESGARRVEQRHLLAAGAAPACPEIDENELAIPFAEPALLAGEIDEIEVGARIAGLEYRHVRGRRGGE